MKRSIFFLVLVILITNSQLSLAKRVDHEFEGMLAYCSKDYNKAKKEFEICAREGNSFAQGQLGSMYYEGKGVHQDDYEALKWFQLSAKQGDSCGQGFLGYMYYHGKGVRQNYHEAFKWFQLGAKQGSSYSQTWLGSMYVNGQGVKQNIPEAKEWFGKACDNGCQLGCDHYRKLNQLGY